MKTFKQYGVTIKGVTVGCIFTLHHVAVGLYWAAPALKDKRLVRISLHLPFFMVSVQWMVKKKSESTERIDKCRHCNALPIDNPQLGCWRFQCKCYLKEEAKLRRVFHGV